MTHSPAYWALVFVCQVAVVFGGLTWFLRATRPGKEIWRAVVDLATWPRRRRAANQARQCHDTYVSWAAQMAYWGHELDRHDPGSASFELAHDIIVQLGAARPARCQCPSCRPADHPRYPRSTHRS